MKKTPLMKKASKGRLDLLKDNVNVVKERKTSTDSATSSIPETPTMEGSFPALSAEPGTLKVSLASVPAIEKMTEKESAHPSTQQLNQLTCGSGNGLLENLPKSLNNENQKQQVMTTISSSKGVEETILESKEDKIISIEDNNIAFEADSEVGSLDVTLSGVVGTETSPGKMSRSISMPISQASPRLNKTRNPSASSTTSSHHGHGIHHMQRSMSVLSGIVS